VGVRAALRGEADRALRIASARATDPGALVLLASVSLDAGLPEEAAMVLERLRKLKPDAAETKLIGALVVERRERPNADWLDAGLAALGAVQPLAEAPPLLAPALLRLDTPLQGAAARCLKPLLGLPIRSLRSALSRENARKGLRCPEPAAARPGEKPAAVR